ncbi:MAG: glycerate kinase [Propionibacteriales bacterium]|nr:glycerate kinase [Propionibacteriales bacterium]
MRILVAPDTFSGPLTAVHAAAAIAEGWRRHAPGDEVRAVPMGDGGPGFVDVLHHALGGDLLSVQTQDPFGASTPAGIVLVDGTAYVESSQACGRHLVERNDADDPEAASTYGVGLLIATAVAEGARTVVVGLGGSGSSDAGAGMLAALGMTGDVAFDQGAAGLAGVSSADLRPVRERLDGVDVVIAGDVDNPLLGLIGTTNVYGGQRGIGEDRLQTVDGWLEGFARATDRAVANQKGAGAGGGLGFGLMLLGGSCRPGVQLVAEMVDLAGAAGWSDLVVTGEGAFDFSSRSGSVTYGVAEAAGRAVRPCIALAGEVLVGSREMRAMGVESAYSVTELVGAEAARDQPYESLARLARRVARTWSH